MICVHLRSLEGPSHHLTFFVVDAGLPRGNPEPSAMLTVAPQLHLACTKGSVLILCVRVDFPTPDGPETMVKRLASCNNSFSSGVTLPSIGRHTLLTESSDSAIVAARLDGVRERDTQWPTARPKSERLYTGASACGQTFSVATGFQLRRPSDQCLST